MTINNEKWVIQRDKVPPRVFGRGAMMKHNIPLDDLRPPREDDNGQIKRDSLIMQCTTEEAKNKIGRIRAFIQRHLSKLKRNGMQEEDLPKFSVMFGENKESIVIWRTK
ncbi:MAG: hypothetical protein GOVbin2604_61 [Gammaproteobacteria virus GOV_bin_2604]|nr:MAG: hypothetical protein GOVbin2604_61 [Gammaproteobacteria virus GOV_bin_2604]|tara:strand:- start:1221 stop:1547 length:327 start_codon:yes stop_codon:yes gene_type:complete